MDAFDPGRWEVKSGLPRVYLDLLEILFPVWNAFIQSPHHMEIVEISPLREAGPVCGSAFNIEEIMERPRCRSGVDMVTYGFKRPQNPPTVGSNLARGNEEIIKDVLHEGIERKSYPVMKGVGIEGGLVEFIKTHPLQVGGHR